MRFVPAALKYIVVVIAAGLLLYNSVYFKRLDEVKAESRGQIFNAQECAEGFWNKLLLRADKATDAELLLKLFRTDMQEAVEKYSRTLGVADVHFYMIQGVGRVAAIQDDCVILSLTESEGDIAIVTDYILGNAIRDASGLVDVSDFPSTMYFNSISSEINKIVSTTVVPLFLEKVEVGGKVRFVGACEVPEDKPEISPLKVVPVVLDVL